MSKLARVCAVAFFWLSALYAFPQAAVISSQAIDQYGAPLPNAQVRVCSATSTGVPCTPTVPIFQDYNLTVPASNPFNADQYGNYTLYAPALPAPNLYTVQVSPASGITWQYVWNGPYCSLAGCTITGNLNVLGSLTACSVNGVVNPTCYSGADIGAKINTALAACANACTIKIPAGSYNFSTQIVLPQNLFGRYMLTGEPGTVLTWMGTTDAILTSPVYIGGSNLIIEGFQLINGGTGTFAGIHLYPTNRDTVQNMVIEGFTDGIRVEGTNSSNILNNWILNNVNGVTILSTFCSGATPNNTCSPTNFTGQNYSVNMLNIKNNQITDNRNWGVDIVDSPGNGDSGALGDVVDSNDLEENGGGGSAFGALYSGKSSGLKVINNYFEASPREIVLGLYDGGAGDYYGTQGALIQGNFFLTAPGTPYNIELENAAGTTIQANSELGAPGVSSANCEINVATGGETGTVLLPNWIKQSPPSGNRLCSNGSPAQYFLGGNSYILFNTNYKAGLVYGEFPITTAASDVVPAVNVATNSSCYATASSNANQVTAQSLITQVWVQPGAGQATIFHPTGHPGLLYDIWCTSYQNQI